MKQRDKAAVAALRSTLGAIDNAEAVPAPDPAPIGDGPIAGAVRGVGAGEAPRQELTEAMVAAIVGDELRSRQAARAEYRRLGRDEHAAQLEAEITALLPYVAGRGDGEPAG